VKKIIFHNIYKELNENNLMFESDNTSIGDDLLIPLQVLDKYAQKRSIIVGTNSKIALRSADAIVFIDYPDHNDSLVKDMYESKLPLYLMLFESVLVNTVKKNESCLDRFNKIFTYNDAWVDNNRFVKINYSFEPKISDKYINFKHKKLCAVIAGNKYSSHPSESYSRRKKDIRWFEQNKQGELDLYGFGWDRINFGSKLPFRILNRFNISPKIIGKSYPSYKGSIKRKRPILEKYKFSLCYENVKDVPGYITEKIFDSMFAGCIPIYLGANNIQDHIPQNCYIDRRNYKSMKSLYDFIASVNEDEFYKYTANIRNFICNSGIKPFLCDTFANTVLNSIEKDI
jgi:alpha(1,3/1,4) fucosyltransferase